MPLDGHQWRHRDAQLLPNGALRVTQQSRTEPLIRARLADDHNQSPPQSLPVRTLVVRRFHCFASLMPVIGLECEPGAPRTPRQRYGRQRAPAWQSASSVSSDPPCRPNAVHPLANAARASTRPAPPVRRPTGRTTPTRYRNPDRRPTTRSGCRGAQRRLRVLPPAAGSSPRLDASRRGAAGPGARAAGTRPVQLRAKLNPSRTGWRGPHPGPPSRRRRPCLPSTP